MNAIIGEMNKISGFVDINGTMSFSMQDPWIIQGSVRENIIIGKEFDRNRFREVIQSLNLAMDITNFPDKDATQIGEKG